MKVVFMGTPEFAVHSLDIINRSHHEVVGVITATDKPAGRGQKTSQSAVKTYALEHNLPVLQPEDLKDPEFIKELKSLNADLFAVVAFRMLPPEVWEMPSKGTVNLHASLLPQYRGAAPINWAIINGEKESGATTFFIEKKMDTGNIIAQVKTPISDEMTAGELHDTLMKEGAKLFLTTIDQIEAGTAQNKPQSELIHGELKKAYKIFTETCAINWSEPAEKIHNLVRGLSPYPAAFSNITIQNKLSTAKIFKTNLTNCKDLAIGRVLTDYKTFLKVGTGDGDLEILELQLAGKKRMSINDFLNGYKNHEIHFN